MTSKAKVRTARWVFTSEAAWNRSALNGEGSVSAFCKDVVLGDFRGPLGTMALEDSCVVIGLEVVWKQQMVRELPDFVWNWS